MSRNSRGREEFAPGIDAENERLDPRVSCLRGLRIANIAHRVGSLSTHTGRRADMMSMMMALEGGGGGKNGRAALSRSPGDV